MSRITRRAALAATCLLAGCGFHPLYGPAADGAANPAQADLAAVWVPVIPNRSGQLLRQALQRRLEGASSGVAKRYTLTVGFALTADSIGIQPDTTATRVRVIGAAPWTLSSDTLDRRVLKTGQAHAMDGYNIIGQQYFAADLENETVTRRVADTLADQIVQQLAIYFRRLASGKA